MRADGTAPSWLLPTRSEGDQYGSRSSQPEAIGHPLGISEVTLERWRSEGIGPKLLKLCGRALYRQIDIDAYEALCLATSTKSRGARVGAE